MLEITDVRIAYGKVQAVRGISLRVAEGEIVSMVGPNGAGKSTTLNAISGVVRPTDGRIVLAGTDLTRIRPHQIVKLGVAHAPEGRRVFPEMTVEENLRIGGYLRTTSAVADTMRMVLGIFPRLEERRAQLAGTLSGGEQQMLSIGRALMAGPRLLLLDEPSFGLAPLVVAEIGRTIRRINRETGLAILIVEQNVTMAFRVSSRAYVLENGQIVLEGESAQLAESAHVRDAYLGR
jgi:branched-chain amino acid transport system ATP-binding protein